MEHAEHVLPVRADLRSVLAIAILATFTVWITWRAKSIELLGHSGQARSALMGKPAPEFDLESLDGRRVSLANYRGKTVALTFWASWCAPCRMELPVLTKLYEQTHNSESSFEILAISIDATPGAAQNAANSLNLPFPVLLDSDGNMSMSYQVEAIPMLFVVNKNGSVVFTHTGFQMGLDFLLAQQFGITNYTPVVTPVTGKARSSNSPASSLRTSTAVSAPVQVSPDNGAAFDALPRTTKLVWSATPGAQTYGVEIDCWKCCSRDKWCSDVGRPLAVRRNLTENEYTFDFVGPQAGRWRVWGIDASGQEGSKSPWRGFIYNR